MASLPPPECAHTIDCCSGSSSNSLSSSFWGRRHSFFSVFQPSPISRASFNHTISKPSPSTVYLWEEQHFPASLNALVCENGPCSSRQCSLPLLLGVDYPIALSPPCQAFSLKTSTRLPRNVLTFRRPGRWVCFGGGPRPRRPRIWKTRQRRGSISKAQKLLNHVRSLSDVKEEVYGALDAFIAWELEFPLVAVKKTLFAFREERAWKRIIQISKWMLGKGQGKTLGTYLLLLEAFDHEGRLEEAQELWERVLTKNLSHTPRSFFAMMIFMFDRHQMYDEVLEVFADMEELDIKPTPAIANKVALVYEKLGIFDKAEKVKEKYPAPTVKYRTVNGRTLKLPVTSTPRGDKRIFQQDSYDSRDLEDTLESADDNFGNSASENAKDIDPDSSQALSEEVRFAQSQM